MGEKFRKFLCSVIVVFSGTVISSIIYDSDSWKIPTIILILANALKVGLYDRYK